MRHYCLIFPLHPTVPSPPPHVQLGWSLSTRGDGSKKVIAMLPSSSAKASQESPNCEDGALSERNEGEEPAVTTLGEGLGTDEKQMVAAVKEEGTVPSAKEEEMVTKEKETEATVREGDIGAVVSEDLQEGATSETPMPLLGQTRKLVQDMTSSLQALLAHHIEVSGANTLCIQCAL